MHLQRLMFCKAIGATNFRNGFQYSVFMPVFLFNAKRLQNKLLLALPKLL